MPEHPAKSASRRASRQTRTERSAGGVVYRQGDGGHRFLLIRDPYENWGLPKGHIEAGETPVEAALREVAEETGLADLELRGELPGIDWFFRDGAWLVHKFCDFFLMESAAGEATPEREEGISACAWLTFDDAIERSSYENAREVLRTAGRRLGLSEEP